MTSVSYKSQSVEWATPQGVFDALDAEFHFTLDACATPENTKCEQFHSADDLWSSLTKPWTGAVWCNPPYGRGLSDWLAKAVASAREEAL